jgi:hypothetical protein
VKDSQPSLKSQKLALFGLIAFGLIAGIVPVLVIVPLLNWNSKNQSENADRILAKLEQTFGVRWPTNCRVRAVRSWSYRARLDGNSANVRTLAILDVEEESFSHWYPTTTNLFEVSSTSMPAENPAFIEKAPWWDVHKVSTGRDLQLFREIKQPPNRLAQLEVHVVRLDTNRAIYINGYVSN